MNLNWKNSLLRRGLVLRSIAKKHVVVVGSGSCGATVTRESRQVCCRRVMSRKASPRAFEALGLWSAIHRFRESQPRFVWRFILKHRWGAGTQPGRGYPPPGRGGGLLGYLKYFGQFFTQKSREYPPQGVTDIKKKSSGGWWGLDTTHSGLGDPKIGSKTFKEGGGGTARRPPPRGSLTDLQANHGHS